MSCGYVLAGYETLATILDNFMEGRRGRWNDNFTRPEMSNFFSKTCAGFLHSYGQDFSGKKKYNKHNEREANVFRFCRNTGFFNNSDFIVDSGGFQISVGRLSRKESDMLYNMYYEWLEEYHDVYDRAFILDIPPGPNCEIFKNFEDVYNLNLESYNRAKNLPEHIRNKIIYVHHFRTPKLSDIYKRILVENDMFNSFQYHATGGIVANMASDMVIPCIIYILPLIPLIKEAIKHNRSFLNFHILGGANFRDVLFYELFTILIKRKHNLDLNITYDSSGLYKQVMIGRFIYVKDHYGNIKKLRIKSNTLDQKFVDYVDIQSISTYNTVQENFDTFADKWKVKRISIDDVYDKERNTFHEDVKVYSMLYTLDIYATIQADLRAFCEEVFPLYEDGHHQEFYDECFKMTMRLNQGNLTKKQKAKTLSILNSLNMLSDLNEKYCDTVISKFLDKDEFTNLDENMRLNHA